MHQLPVGDNPVWDNTAERIFDKFCITEKLKRREVLLHEGSLQMVFLQILPVREEKLIDVVVRESFADGLKISQLKGEADADESVYSVSFV